MVNVTNEAIIITNKGFILATNKCYLYLSDSFSNNDTLLVGIVYRPENKEYCKIMSSDDAFLTLTFAYTLGL
jgi:hypothetical protein